MVSHIPYDLIVIIILINIIMVRTSSILARYWRVLNARHTVHCPHCSGNVRCPMGTRIYIAALAEAEREGETVQPTACGHYGSCGGCMDSVPQDSRKVEVVCQCSCDSHADSHGHTEHDITT